MAVALGPVVDTGTSAVWHLVAVLPRSKNLWLHRPMQLGGAKHVPLKSDINVSGGDAGPRLRVSVQMLRFLADPGRDT